MPGRAGRVGISALEIRVVDLRDLVAVEHLVALGRVQVFVVEAPTLGDRRRQPVSRPATAGTSAGKCWCDTLAGCRSSDPGTRPTPRPAWSTGTSATAASLSGAASPTVPWPPRPAASRPAGPSTSGAAR